MKSNARETRIGLILVIPALLGIGVFHYHPMLRSFLYSFFSLDAGADWRGAEFVGFGNYREIAGSSRFWYTLSFTVGFMVCAVLLDLGLGMALALASFYVVKPLRALLRAVIIVPWAVPKVIQASMWRWMLNGDSGPAGDIAVKLGLAEEAPLFLVNRLLAAGSVLTAYTWKGASISAFFLMGGLALIPVNVTEAARVDGAGPLRRFAAVTLPMLMPTIYVALLYRSQDALRVFDVIYGLTGGGPGTTTDALSTFAYTAYFRYGRFGQGSTYAVVNFILVAAVGVLYIARLRGNLGFRE